MQFAIGSADAEKNPEPMTNRTDDLVIDSNLGLGHSLDDCTHNLLSNESTRQKLFYFVVVGLLLARKSIREIV